MFASYFLLQKRCLMIYNYFIISYVALPFNHTLTIDRQCSLVYNLIQEAQTVCLLLLQLILLLYFDYHLHCVKQSRTKNENVR